MCQESFFPGHAENQKCILRIREDGLVLVDRFCQLGHMLVFVVSIHQEVCTREGKGKREKGRRYPCEMTPWGELQRFRITCVPVSPEV
jgi:hypothetical protein